MPQASILLESYDLTKQQLGLVNFHFSLLRNKNGRGYCMIRNVSATEQGVKVLVVYPGDHHKKSIMRKIHYINCRFVKSFKSEINILYVHIYGGHIQVRRSLGFNRTAYYLLENSTSILDKRGFSPWKITRIPHYSVLR